MKCKYCGANMSMEDEYCPYCGALNEEARKHIEDMRKYNRAFHRTRSQVMDTAGRQSRRHARVITIAVLVMLNVIVMAGHAASYDLQYWWEEVQVNAHAEEHRERLTELEAAGDYQELEEYYSQYSLYMADQLREFDAVDYGAQYYNRTYESLMRLIDPGFDDSYYTDGELLEMLAEQVTYFYENMEQGNDPYYAERYASPHKEALEDMDGRIQTLLKVYCSLTDQDLESIKENTMSSQELMLLIGRRMGIYE